MRIGLASDSHGNLDALARAFDLFARADVEQVFFLGGRCGDVDGVLARRRSAAARPARPDPLAARIVRVASRACPEYRSGAAPRTHVDLLDGKICCLVHDKAELSRDDIENATVFFHGNAPQAGLVRIGPRVFATPGQLRADAAHAGPGAASFALAELDGGELSLTVFSAEAAELRQERVSLSTHGKLSVR